MERQVQKQGIRYWYGDHIISAQDNLFRALEEGLLASLGPAVLNGCEVTSNGGSYNVSAGLVYVGGRICIFDGINNSQLPVYLTPVKQTSSANYTDGQSREVSNTWKATAATVQPQSEHITISSNSKDRAVLVRIGEDGTLHGLPKSSSLVSTSEEQLATSKAASLLQDQLDRVGGAYFYRAQVASPQQYQNPQQLQWDEHRGLILRQANNNFIDTIQGGFYRMTVLKGGTGNFLSFQVGQQQETLQDGVNYVKVTDPTTAGYFSYRQDDEFELFVELIAG